MGWVAHSVIDVVRLGVAGVVIGGGLLLVLGGALGVLKFPDFYTRLHAQRVADGLGPALIMLGLAIGAWSAAISWKLVFLALLMVLIAPLTAQLSAGAAHAGGLAPLSGSDKAPRTGGGGKT